MYSIYTRIIASSHSGNSILSGVVNSDSRDVGGTHIVSLDIDGTLTSIDIDAEDWDIKVVGTASL